MIRSKFNKEDQLFIKGIQAFNKKQFYESHEIWEELWLEYYLEDANLIQGLIQLAVSYFHLFNQNLKGSRSMANKCLKKIAGYEITRGIDVSKLYRDIESLQLHLNDINITSEFKDRYILKIKVIHDQ